MKTDCVMCSIFCTILIINRRCLDRKKLHVCKVSKKIKNGEGHSIVKLIITV